MTTERLLFNSQKIKVLTKQIAISLQSTTALVVLGGREDIKRALTSRSKHHIKTS